MKKIHIVLKAIVTAILFCVICIFPLEPINAVSFAAELTSHISLSDIEPYHGVPFVPIENNIPAFEIQELATSPYIKFSSFDDLGRTGTGMACLSGETLPTRERGQIGNIRPSGWHTIRYDDLIEDRFLYNRCHVLGYQLTGDNATPENLFTGTRYLNMESMLFFENKVATYLRDYGENHVIYRVTPLYEKNNLVATGVQMEAFSVEDHGEGVCYNVFVYNVQPGILINYADGESQRDPNYNPGTVISTAAAYSTPEQSEILRLEADYSGNEDISVKSMPKEAEASEKEITYILNTNTKKFHYPECKSVSDMKEKNKKEFSGSREEAISEGYVPCKRCNP